MLGDFCIPSLEIAGPGRPLGRGLARARHAERRGRSGCSRPTTSTSRPRRARCGRARPRTTSHRAVSKGFTDRGYHLGHVTGHSIGMTMIEFPKIGEGVETELRENMVFSMHPHAIAEDGRDCLYMQDTWLVTPTGDPALGPPVEDLLGHRGRTPPRCVGDGRAPAPAWILPARTARTGVTRVHWAVPVEKASHLPDEGRAPFGPPPGTVPGFKRGARGARRARRGRPRRPRPCCSSGPRSRRLSSRDDVTMPSAASAATSASRPSTGCRRARRCAPAPAASRRAAPSSSTPSCRSAFSSRTWPRSRRSRSPASARSRRSPRRSTAPAACPPRSAARRRRRVVVDVHLEDVLGRRTSRSRSARSSRTSSRRQ